MEDLSGKQLGVYRVVSLQGEGGMAAVFKAYQPAMDRYVALKVLPRHFASNPQFVARFEQEARVLARLQHPHILPVFDFGEADGYTYLVMPLVTGGTLVNLLTGQPLPLAQVRTLISQVGDALDYAHTQGLIHRDVKPSNVLRDQRGNCLLTDFGLAKILEGAPGLTTSSGILGTPAYMSPEQGLGQPLSCRTDIYALGVILYEMATGRAPYLADTPMAIVVKEETNMSRSALLQSAQVHFRKIPNWAKLYYAALGVWLTTTAMHIPDGYLSPATCVVMFLIMLPFWYVGLRKLREKLNAKSAPLIALLAAFSFIIMMFNVPLPGGTTGHAVGGALAAIILGPEIASLAVSIALIIQAFFFGDGGILAIGANCFNMAVVLPYVSYAIYQAISGKFPVASRRRVIGAFVGGWLALTVAAFFAGVEFGIQPALFHTADGTPLYAPYPLSVSIPAMVIPHLLVAGVVEGVVSALVVAYLQRTNEAALKVTATPALAIEASGFGRLRWLWVGLAVLIVATPLGLLAPGTAWGEWGSDQFTELGLKFIPQGLKQLEGLWGAPLKDYDVAALGNSTLGYILSAGLGIVVVGIVAWLFTAALTAGRTPAKKEQA